MRYEIGKINSVTPKQFGIIGYSQQWSVYDSDLHRYILADDASLTEVEAQSIADALNNTKG